MIVVIIAVTKIIAPTDQFPASLSGTLLFFYSYLIIFIYHSYSYILYSSYKIYDNYSNLTWWALLYPLQSLQNLRSGILCDLPEFLHLPKCYTKNLNIKIHLLSSLILYNPSHNSSNSLVVKLCPTLMTPWTVAYQLLCPWDSPGKNTGVGCHFLLQGIFPTQELNPGLLHCRQILYRLSYEGSPMCHIMFI